MTIELHYRREPPTDVACIGFRNVSGHPLVVMPPGGAEPIEVVADGRVLIALDDLARSPDLVLWLIWLIARRLVVPIDQAEM